MRTTVRIDDELLEQLKEQARKESTSLTRLIERTLRAGLQAGRRPSRPRRPFREATRGMGVPRINVDKALALVNALEDEEIARKMLLRK
jgi:predicted transcriptional regulator